MPGEKAGLRAGATALEHRARAEHLLQRSARVDQSMAGFALAQSLAAEALAHAAVAALPEPPAEPPAEPRRGGDPHDYVGEP